MNSSLTDFAIQNRMDLRAARLVRDFFEPDSYEHFAPPGGSRTKKRKPGPPPISRLPRNKEQAILKHRTQTVITPIVSRIATNLFKRSMEVTGTISHEIIDEEVVEHIRKVEKAHHSNPKSMKWGPDPPVDGKWYASIEMDGIVYKVRRIPT
jgi:hypothetical protein